MDHTRDQEWRTARRDAVAPGRGVVREPPWTGSDVRLSLTHRRPAYRRQSPRFCTILRATGKERCVSRADPITVPWAVYDLRRTAATGLAKLGCPRVVQNRILNHVDGSVSAIYDRHRYDDEVREWLQKWADRLDSLRGNNVVMLYSKIVSRPGTQAGAADSGQHYLRAGDANR